MQMFSRMMALTGNETDAMGWATKMTAYVNDHVDRPVTAWSAGFGYPVGTVVWSAWVASHADLLTAFGGLAGDKDYDAMARAGEAFTSPPQDSMRQLIHPAAPPDSGPPPLGSVAVVTAAVVAGGKYAEAMGWGVQVAQHVTSVSGMNTSFLADMYGTFGLVTWIGVAPDMAAADAASDKINADAEYMKMLGAVGDLFVPASGHRALFTRFA
jgi:hypothetical protein